jgi:integrase
MRPDDVAAVLAAAATISPLAALTLRLAAVTGARRGELAGLQWDDIREDVLTIARSITIRRADPSEGRPEPELVEGPTKTHAVRRLTLDPQTVALVTARRVECEAMCIEADVPLGPWILSPDFGNDTPASPEALSRLWRRCRKRAGIDSHWRLHDLRHWAATSLIAGGEDVRLVAGRLGHARPATTLDVYAHFIDRGDERAASKLSDLLGPAADASDPAEPRGRDAQSGNPGAPRRARRHGRAPLSRHRPG